VNGVVPFPNLSETTVSAYTFSWQIAIGENLTLAMRTFSTMKV
jgi:hypothetical protein